MSRFRFAALATAVIIGLGPALVTTAGAATASVAATARPAAARGGAQITTWQARYRGLGAQSQPAAAAVSPDGSAVFVTGFTGYRARSWGTVAYNTITGAVLWKAVYRHGLGVSDVAVSPDGTAVFVTGGAGTVAYNAATGAQLWVSGPAGGNSIAVSHDGSTVFVAGLTQMPNGLFEYVTTAHAASSGAILWTSYYHRGDLTGGGGNPGISVSPDGSVLYESGSSNSTFVTVAYSASTGAKLWVRFYGPAGGQSIAAAIATSPDGSTVFVTGSSATTSGGHFAYATVAYAATTGKRLWAERYDLGGGLYEPESLAVSPDGSAVFVTGSGGSYSNATTVAYGAASGSTLWVRRRGGGNGLYTGVSPDGSTVFVVSAEFDETVTLAYNASDGSQAWLRQYQGGGTAEAGAVNPARAQVFAISATVTPGTHNVEYGTVSYTVG